MVNKENHNSADDQDAAGSGREITSSDSRTSRAREADYEWENTGRDRGIFTPHDRKYLLEDIELSGQDERNARYRIRQRLVQSLYDLYLLEFISQDDLSQVINENELINGKLGTDLACRILSIDSEAKMPVETLKKQIRESIATYLVGQSDNSRITKANISIEIEVSNDTISIDYLTDTLGADKESVERLQDRIDRQDAEIEFYIDDDSFEGLAIRPSDDHIDDESDTQ